MTASESEKQLCWQTSVSELMTIFRDALVSIVPHLERTQIPIGVHAGVDAWDEISEVLFRHIVIEAIRSALPLEEMDALQMPTYETDYSDYREISFIEVIPKDETTVEAHYVFHSFVVSEGNRRFSEVKCRVVDERGAFLTDNVRIFAFRAVTFQCIYRTGQFVRALDQLKVTL